MPLIPAKCTCCGSLLEVDRNKEAAICPYCNTPYVVEKAINHFNTTYNMTIHSNQVIITEHETSWYEKHMRDQDNEISSFDNRKISMKSELDTISNTIRSVSFTEMERVRDKWKEIFIEYMNKRISSRNYLSYDMILPKKLFNKKTIRLLDSGLKSRINHCKQWDWDYEYYSNGISYYFDESGKCYSVLMTNTINKNTRSVSNRGYIVPYQGNLFKRTAERYLQNEFSNLCINKKVLEYSDEEEYNPDKDMKTTLLHQEYRYVGLFAANHYYLYIYTAPLTESEMRSRLSFVVDSIGMGNLKVANDLSGFDFASDFSRARTFPYIVIDKPQVNC